jgi:DUF4097 and DUF4098 domain-containing protein YvlB
MASYPPPYPPPAGPPYGYDPRSQNRILRDQVKTQRAAYKAQREAYKQQQRAILLQARGLRRGSILGPLIVVGLGVVLLLVRMGTLPFARFAGWYGRWWPLLFVAAGLVLVAEWAFDQTTHTGQTPYVRRGTGGGVFLLLLVLAVTGGIVRGWTDGTAWFHNLSINPDNLAEFVGDKHEREQTIEQSFPAGTSLSLSDPHGDITIMGKSGDDRIHIVAYKQVYSQSDAEADQKAQELSPDVQFADGGMRITVPTRAGATVDLTVTVPDYAQTTVDSGRGDVHITGLRSAVSVTANHGDVDVNTIVGPVTAHINHRDSSFSAHTVTGDVTLRGNVDDLNLTGITGSVSLDGDFYGDTHLEHIGGATSFKTSRTALAFARLDGTVDISPEAELTGDLVVGPTVLTTRSRNIALQHVVGDVNVTNSNGSVDLSSQGEPGEVTINDRSGAITWTVPEGSGFNVEAQTTGGAIENDFGFPVQGSNNRSSVSAKVGSGRSRVSLFTTHGDIAVRKGGSIAAPAPPEPPTRPVSPSKLGKSAKAAKVGASVSF